MLFEKTCINLTSRVNFFMQHLPSGSPSERAAKIKTLAITTFASCILLIPAPVLWNSLMRHWNLCNLYNVRMSVSNKCRDFYSQWKTMLRHVTFFSCWILFIVVWWHMHRIWCSVNVSTCDIICSKGVFVLWSDNHSCITRWPCCRNELV